MRAVQWLVVRLRWRLRCVAVAQSVVCRESDVGVNGWKGRAGAGWMGVVGMGVEVRICDQTWVGEGVRTRVSRGSESERGPGPLCACGVRWRLGI